MLLSLVVVVVGVVVSVLSLASCWNCVTASNSRNRLPRSPNGPGQGSGGRVAVQDADLLNSSVQDMRLESPLLVVMVIKIPVLWRHLGALMTQRSA